MTATRVKIALLSPFTIRGLAEALEVECKKVSLDADFYVAEYEKIYDEILSADSGLKNFKPDLSFLLFNKPDQMIKIKDIINPFLENISGTLVVSNIPPVTYSPFGSYNFKQGKHAYALKSVVSKFNDELFQRSGKEGRFSVYDFAGFFSKYGEYNIVDEKLYYLGDIYIKPEFMPRLAGEMMGFVKARFSKNRKCIVLDLDNTLWGGIVGEDGFAGIALDTKPPGNTYLDFQKYLLALNQRGIILAVASRNNYDDAIKVIREHPFMQLREDNFASVQINWEDKASQIKKIAEEINIGLDSMVFFDDDAVNRELVRRSLPEVLVVDLPKDSAEYVRKLKEINDFDTLLITEEDFQRSGMYVAQRKAHELKSRFSNKEEFLQSLEMTHTIAAANDFTIPRIAQLTQKTNQFNVTTRRYTEEDIRRFASDPQWGVYSVAVKDKFGDHGIVGAFVVQKKAHVFAIDTFLLSCRVIGRDIEKRMLEFVRAEAAQAGVSEIRGEYVPTEKNAVCKDVYRTHGFLEPHPNQFALTLS